MRIFTVLALCSVFALGSIVYHSPHAYAASAKKTKKLQKKLKQQGLKVFPDSNDLLAARGGSTNTNDVSGTPPPLVEFPDSDIKNLFWRPGVVDAIGTGTPTQEQCNEFFSGAQDGTSGGLGACVMSENVGRAFQLLSEGGISLCYMKNFPSTENLEAGGVTLDSGTLPNGDITKIFAPPSSGSARHILVHVSGFEEESEEDINIKVFPINDKFAYRVDLWFCREGQVRGRNRITISKEGDFVALDENNVENEAFSSRVQAKLTIKDGVPAFDNTQTRRLISRRRDQNGAFKSLTVIKGNLIETRTLDIFGESSRKSNMITRFSGEDASAVRFLEGAFSSREQGGGFSGATEYRDSFYAAAPENALIEKVDSSSDLEDDAFFEDLPKEEYEMDKYECGEEPDIELSLDMSNPTLLQSVQQCENRQFDGMRFCFEEGEVRTAMDRYQEVCGGGGN